MATSLENNVSGGSDSDLDFSSAPEDIPSTVIPPEHDGLPQTGPKGVLTDFYRTQQAERRKQILAQQKRKEIIEKHSATVQSYSEENKREQQGSGEDTAMTNLAMALEGGTLDEDPFLQQYRAKRMEALKQEARRGTKRERFGHLVDVRGDKYDVYIENALPQTFVIMHIYDEFLPVCQHLNKCLSSLARLYPTARFCRVQASQVGVSPAFVSNGLPAVLVYRGGDLVGNLLRITDQLGDTYTTEDLETFLHEKNCLPPDSEKEENALLPKNFLGISKKQSVSTSDSD